MGARTPVLLRRILNEASPSIYACAQEVSEEHGGNPDDGCAEPKSDLVYMDVSRIAGMGVAEQRKREGQHAGGQEPFANYGHAKQEVDETDNSRAREVGRSAEADAESENNDEDECRCDFKGWASCPRIGFSHWLAIESRKRPRLVKQTIIASIQYCDLVATRRFVQSEMARSWASVKPTRCPARRDPSWMYQMASGLIAL